MANRAEVQSCTAKAGHHDLAPIINVGGMASEEGQGEHRQELGEAQHADRERRLGDRRSLARDRIDLPGERDRLNLHGERGAEPADPEPDIGFDAQKVAQRRRVLQDSFGGDDAAGARIGRGGGHEGVLLGGRSGLRQGLM